MADYRKYFDAFRFRVEIAGVVTAHLFNAGPFKMTVSGIEVPVTVGSIDEDLPGKVKMARLMLEGPANELFGLYHLFKATGDCATGFGETEPSLFQDLDFVQLDRDGEDLEIIRVYKCWAADYELSKFDKKENDKRRETLEISGQYFERLSA